MSQVIWFVCEYTRRVWSLPWATQSISRRIVFWGGQAGGEQGTTIYVRQFGSFSWMQRGRKWLVIWRLIQPFGWLPTSICPSSVVLSLGIKCASGSQVKGQNDRRNNENAWVVELSSNTQVYSVKLYWLMHERAQQLKQPIVNIEFRWLKRYTTMHLEAASRIGWLSFQMQWFFRFSQLERE